MNEIIKKLKDKTYVRAFGLMTQEERDCFKKVGKGNCVYFSSSNGWFGCIEDSCGFMIEYTYAIKPDYQPEPEYVDLGIYHNTAYKYLGADLEDGYYFIQNLSGLPNFEGFYINKYSDWTPAEYQRISHRIEVEKKKVFARFRK
jgi:hypothetical protein